jgi:hypothetical protein
MVCKKCGKYACCKDCQLEAIRVATNPGHYYLYDPPFCSYCCPRGHIGKKSIPWTQEMDGVDMLNAHSSSVFDYLMDAWARHFKRYLVYISFNPDDYWEHYGKEIDFMDYIERSVPHLSKSYAHHLSVYHELLLIYDSKEDATKCADSVTGLMYCRLVSPTLGHMAEYITTSFKENCEAIRRVK